MATISPAQKVSVPVRSLDGIRPRTLNVGPDRTGQSVTVGVSDHPGQNLAHVMRDALLKHYGSVKEMAFALGNVDPSLMNREFDAGKIARVSAYCDEKALAAVTEAMADAFGLLTDPRQRMKQTIRNMRRELDEIEQGVELIA